ncbi:molybdenum cofactor guanylyltransferase [bacterium]|nr:molybdenum cofactor guanylyltransferase [bacterium]
MPLIGAILLGGQSSRMGRPKEGVLLPDGRTMLQAVIERVTRICPVKVLSGESVNLPNVLNVQDTTPGLGPMAGLEAILASGVAERYLIAACDQPLLGEAVLERLVGEPRARVVVPRGANGFLYPLPGVYDRSVLAQVSERIEKRELSLIRLLSDVGARAIDVSEDEEESLRSFNTPDELQELFETMKARR